MSDLPAGVTLQELRTFLVLAEDAHFGRAAERLFLSQPYLSRTIASLERKLGGQLVDRGHHRLTSFGHSALSELRPAYMALSVAIEQTRAGRGGHVLRLGCTYAVDRATMVALRAAYADVCPGGELEVIETMPDSPYLAIRDGEVDAFVWWREAPARDFEYGPTIQRQRVVAGMGSDHPLATRDDLTLEDLADYRVLLPQYADHPEPASIIFPATAPSGRVIARGPSRPGYLARAAYDLADSDDLFMLTEGVVGVFEQRSDLHFAPVTDAPAYRLAPMWLRVRADDRIHALVGAARRLVQRVDSPRSDSRRRSGGA